jgi:hypothetical protein
MNKNLIPLLSATASVVIFGSVGFMNFGTRGLIVGVIGGTILGIIEIIVYKSAKK